MSDHDHASRIAVLEHQMGQLASLPEAIHNLDKKIDRVLERKECPAPGMCKELDIRLSELETTTLAAKAEARGGWKVITAISSVLGGVAGWLVNHFTNNPPTKPHP